MSQLGSTQKIIASNRRAFFNYEIVDKIETGIVLNGHEVKSIRAGKIELRDSYARIKNGELWLYNLYIAPYDQGGQFSDMDPNRNRKLLAHKKQILKMASKSEEKGLVLVPTKLYFARNNVKVELGLGKPKKRYDKRQSIKERDIKRAMDRRLS